MKFKIVDFFLKGFITVYHLNFTNKTRELKS